MTTYQLRKNYITLNFSNEAKLTLVIGLSFTLALYFLLIKLPDDFPSTFIPLLYSATGMTMAQLHHLSKAEVAESTEFTFESNWKVAWLALSFGILWGLAGFVILLPLIQLGLIDL